jgi:hypothetical protein
MNRRCPNNLVVILPPPAGETRKGSLSAMTPTLRTTGFAGAAACIAAGLVVIGVVPVAGQSQPQQVLSDTPAYCLQLLDRVSELVRVASAPPPQEVTSLSSEGQRMCDQGLTRGGILRLRRALMIMMHPDIQQ